MIIACLQVRLKSKRFPKKAMVNVKNKPLFLHVAERINSSKKVDKLIICTSKNKQDLPIIDVCKKQNIEYFAGEEDDVVKRYIDAVSKYEPDHVVRVTGDNPCVSFEFIDLAIKEHLSKNSKYTTTDDLPRGMRSEIIDFNFLRNLHVKLVDPAMTEYMSWYLDRPDKWKVVKVNMPQKLKRSHYRLTVDKKIDLDVIKKVYDVLYKGTPIDSYKIVKFLDENQDVVMLNSSIKQRLHNDLKDKVDIRTFDEVS